MFETGEFIIYGNNGVCRVEHVGPIDTPRSDGKRLYYTLSPFYIKGSTIFTPIDNTKVLMRPIMSKAEATSLIDDMKDIETLWIDNEKTREQEYKEAIATCDSRELVKIIKTIYLRKQSRLAEGKKVTATDERYFKLAEDNLYGELAIPLGMSREDTKKFVEKRVKELTE